MTQPLIRPAVPGDEPHVARFILDLARYERLEHEVDLSEERLKEHLFGERPVCGALICEHEGAPVGFALHFTSYSTFWCKPCLFLEDLYVDPEHRGRGYGLALLRACAQLAVEREDFTPEECDPMQPHHLHVQASVGVTMTGPDGTVRRGKGVLEQLVIGPHAPSGFRDVMDPAS